MDPGCAKGETMAIGDLMGLWVGVPSKGPGAELCPEDEILLSIFIQTIKNLSDCSPMSEADCFSQP